MAERNQRTEIVEMELRQRRTGEPRLDCLHEQRRLLMGDLRAWRQYRAFLAGLRPGARSAVAHREDVGIARRLKRLADDELMRAIDFEAVQVREDGWRLDPGGPDDQVRVEHVAGRAGDAFRIDFRNAF